MNIVGTKWVLRINSPPLNFSSKLYKTICNVIIEAKLGIMEDIGYSKMSEYLQSPSDKAYSISANFRDTWSNNV